MEHVKANKVHRIFITCLSADCVSGLPGLLCTLSASRVQGHEMADIPIHLYGPPGLTEFISTVLKVGISCYVWISMWPLMHSDPEPPNLAMFPIQLNSSLGFPPARFPTRTLTPPSSLTSSACRLSLPRLLNLFVSMSEFTGEGKQPLLVLAYCDHPPRSPHIRRSRIFRVLLPPDQLNPEGFIDADISAFLPNQGRATVKKGATSKAGVLGTDPRAAYLPFDDPLPGDPTR